MIKCLKFPKEKIKVFLHLYDDMGIQKEIDFWSQELRMPKSSFNKPYIKKSKRIDLDQKVFGHGTCGVRAFSTVTKEKILMTTKAIADYYEEELGKI